MFHYIVSGGGGAYMSATHPVPRCSEQIPADKLARRLGNVLERYRNRWDPKELAELARQLREFADSLDSPKGGRKAKKE